MGTDDWWHAAVETDNDSGFAGSSLGFSAADAWERPEYVSGTAR
jgi:hypothetical protein